MNFLFSQADRRLSSRRERELYDAILPDWPSRRPDLTPLDFWCWARIKSIIFKRRSGWSKTEAAIERAIVEAVNSIPQAEIDRTVKEGF